MLMDYVTDMTHVPTADAVGSKVPADLRLIELLSNVFRTDQVCSLQLICTAKAPSCLYSRLEIFRPPEP